MKEILINNIFNENPGAYANEGQNIVHEIINLFKAENGKHYIYIVKDGMISEERNEKISDILLTRSVGNKTVEIIAWVKEPKQLVRQEKWKSKSKNKEELYIKQKDYIDDIRYDKNYKIRVDKIFENNTYRGKKDDDNIIYATFVADKVLKPKEELFLTYDKNNAKNSNTFYISKRINNNSQRLYINKEDKEIFATMKKIFEPKNWEDKDTFKRVDVDKFLNNQKNEEEHFNFLKLIHHEYYEPAFSNLFQYYFLKNKEIFKKFAKEKLNTNINVNSEDFEIKREEYDIDILIRDTNNIIVIENKIKSGINGVKYDDYGKIVQTQLKKYYDYAKGRDNSKQKQNKNHPHYNDKKRNAKFFIFMPNYKNIDTNKFEKEAKNYKIIKYDEIYNFYKKHKRNFKEDKYFEDFINAMYKHTLKVDSELYDIMLERFVSAIQKAHEQGE